MERICYFRIRVLLTISNYRFYLLLHPNTSVHSPKEWSVRYLHNPMRIIVIIIRRMNNHVRLIVGVVVLLEERVVIIIVLWIISYKQAILWDVEITYVCCQSMNTYSTILRVSLSILWQFCWMYFYLFCIAERFQVREDYLHWALTIIAEWWAILVYFINWGKREKG